MTSQRGSKFQNSEILLSEKKKIEPNLLQFLILIFLLSVVHDIQIWVFLNQFLDDASKWRWFYKGMIHLMVPFTFVFHLSITISTWDTSSGLLTSQFCINDFTTLSQNLKILRELFYKRIIYLKLPLTFDFHLSINNGTWNINLDLFHPFWGW